MRGVDFGEKQMPLFLILWIYGEDHIMTTIDKVESRFDETLYRHPQFAYKN